MLVNLGSKRPDCQNPHCENAKETGLVIMNDIILCGKCILKLHKRKRKLIFDALKK